MAHALEKNGAAPHPKSADTRDVKIGRLVRARRRQQGFSQSDLAERIGVTYQQVHNYEIGRIRITIGRLIRIAKALDVPPTFFFARETKSAKAFGKKSHELFAAGGALRLMKAYDRFPAEELRSAIVDLVEKIANTKKGGC